MWNMKVLCSSWNGNIKWCQTLRSVEIKRKQGLYDKANVISRFQKISSMYILSKAEKDLKKVMRQKEELAVIQLEN